MTLNDWFNKGMTREQYINSMSVNKEEVEQIYNEFELSPAEKDAFSTLRDKKWRVIALTADWCGDAMLCVPVVMKICDAASIEMRLLIRDDNLELMDQYLTNGKSRSIPKFIFIDKEGREQAVWGPRAPEVQQLIDHLRRTLPAKEDPTFAEKQKIVYKGFRERLIADPEMKTAVSRSVKESLVS